MAFTATINSITLQDDKFNVCVVFNDGATSFTSSRTYIFENDSSFTQAVLVAQIMADGAIMKSSLARLNALQSKIGSSVTI